MKNYKLTEEQKEKIHNSNYTNFQFFNCVQDINDDWFLLLSDNDINEIKNKEWSYILELPEGEYVPKPPIKINFPNK
jgi:hypothetical protein